MYTRRIDQSYPWKTTIAYVLGALAVDALGMVVAAHHGAAEPTLIWEGGGLLLCLPMGPLAVVVTALTGAAIGTVVAVVAKILFHKYQQAAAVSVAEGRSTVELLLVLGWAIAGLAAYHLAEATLFPGFSGVLAAVNVLLARPIIHPELVDLYWLAQRLPMQAAVQGAASAVESSQ